MTAHRNRYHTLWFDPGYIATGWAWFVIDVRAFTHHSIKVLPHVVDWDTGEFKGTPFDQIEDAKRLIERVCYGEMPYVPDRTVGSEDFRLAQLIGATDELMAPVRFNAVIGHECQRLYGTFLELQDRSLRTGITKDRLRMMGFSASGKDSFAAMQHALVWLRRQKKRANRLPWKLYE